MDTEQTDAVDIGVAEHISEIFNGQVSLADRVGQENTLENGKLQEKESKDGDCHIFNYQDFHTLPPRIGSEKDAKRLELDFTQLNLEVHCHQNLLYKETFRILNEASKKDYSKCKYFICCFLTHGKQHFLWTKDRIMKFDDILKIFSESSSLKGIPKIFIIQACQGETPEEGVSADSTDGGFSTDTQDYLDFLIVNSTYFDTVSFRYTYEKVKKGHGSFFVDEFCRSLEEFSSKLDLLQILTIVNYRMSHFFLSHHTDKMEIDQKKQMPCFTSTLRKKVEFKREIKQFISTDTKLFENRRKKHWSGPDSTEYFLLNSNFYNIKRVLYLAVVNEQMIDKEDQDVQRAIHFDLWGTFAIRNYSRIKFQGEFQKSEILKFLDQSSNKPLERNESKAKKSSEIDCLICYIAANSKNDCICDAEDRKILKKEIVAEIISQLKKSFVGKPKIFIFLLRKLSDSEETLRSKRFYEDIDSEEDTESDTESNDTEFQNSTDGGIDQNMNSTGRFNAEIESTDGGCVGKNLIPVHADILEISITVSDWKHIVKPLKLFQKILDEKSASTDLISLLTEFNCELIEKFNFFYVPKKMSKFGSSFTVSSTLTKDLFLP